MTVVGSAARPTQRSQIELVIARAKERGEPLRIRLPLSLYDHTDSRSYIFLRDAAWNLSLPVEQATAETIEELIATIGSCLVAVARHGGEKVRVALDGLEPGVEGTTI